MDIKRFKGFGVLAAAVLAGCASDGPSRPQVAATERAASGPIESQAIAFEAYMRRARRIDPAFTGPQQVADGLQAAASHEPVQLEAGIVAYAALAALQEPSFVAGVRSAARNGGLARSLAEDPARAEELPGAAAAAARASGALMEQGERLRAQGLRVKQAAYTTQHQSWSKDHIHDAPGRLARVKHISTIAYAPQAGDAAYLREALAQGGRHAGAPSPVVTRGLALAALSVLGEEAKGRALMSEPRTGSCLRLAKLNLYQCLASSGAQYEDIYCLGQHAMADPGQCVADAAKAPAGRHAYASLSTWKR